MSRLHLIIRNREKLRNPTTLQLLETAAGKLGVECQVIESSKQYFYTEEPKTLETGSMLYRLNIDRGSALLEYLLVGPGVSTFYRDISALFARRYGWSSDIALAKVGLPVIPTVYLVSMPSEAEIKAIVERLGGFPVVVKGVGGSHGSSVRLASSFDELMQISKDLITNSPAELVIKRYLPNARHIRGITIGDQAVDFIEYHKPENDFRTNATDTPQVTPFGYSSELADLAVNATKSAGLYFSGVDILIDNGNPYIAEINYPCNFARNQLATGKDIAALMIDFLRSNKSAELT